MKKYKEAKKLKTKTGFESDDEDKPRINVQGSSTLSSIQNDLNRQDGTGFSSGSGFNNEPSPSNTPSYPSTSQHNSQQSYMQSKNYDYETKVIEDILVPTGISLKPNETQLKDFVRKIKTLDKDFIFNKLLEKISTYEDGLSNPNYYKVLNKAIYVIEAVLISKEEYFQEAFNNVVNLFEDIRGCYFNHSPSKKMVEALNNVIFLLTGQTQEQPKKITANTNIGVETYVKSNMNLLDIDPPQKSEVVESKAENNNLLEIGFTVNNQSQDSSNNSKSKGFSFIKNKNAPVSPRKNDDTQVSQGSNQVSNQGQGQKGFNFIKKKETNQSPQEKINQATGSVNFEEIFTGSGSSNVGQRNQINEIINNLNTIDLTKVISPGINEIYEQPKKEVKIDFESINSVYQQYNSHTNNSTNVSYSNWNQSQGQGSTYGQVGYSHGYGNQTHGHIQGQPYTNNFNTNVGINAGASIPQYQQPQYQSHGGKPKKEDTFDFVNSMLKKK